MPPDSLFKGRVGANLFGLNLYLIQLQPWFPFEYLSNNMTQSSLAGPAKPLCFMHISAQEFNKKLNWHHTGCGSSFDRCPWLSYLYGITASSYLLRPKDMWSGLGPPRCAGCALALITTTITREVGLVRVSGSKGKGGCCSCRRGTSNDTFDDGSVERHTQLLFEYWEIHVLVHVLQAISTPTHVCSPSDPTSTHHKYLAPPSVNVLKVTAAWMNWCVDHEQRFTVRFQSRFKFLCTRGVWHCQPWESYVILYGCTANAESFSDSMNEEGNLNTCVHVQWLIKLYPYMRWPHTMFTRC